MKHDIFANELLNQSELITCKIHEDILGAQFLPLEDNQLNKLDIQTLPSIQLYHLSLVPQVSDSFFPFLLHQPNI